VLASGRHLQELGREPEVHDVARGKHSDGGLGHVVGSRHPELQTARGPQRGEGRHQAQLESAAEITRRGHRRVAAFSAGSRLKPRPVTITRSPGTAPRVRLLKERDPAHEEGCLADSRPRPDHCGGGGPDASRDPGTRTRMEWARSGGPGRACFRTGRSARRPSPIPPEPLPLGHGHVRRDPDDGGPPYTVT
jgi:hypothetical protein